MTFEAIGEYGEAGSVAAEPGLSGILDALVHTEKQIAALQARQIRLMAEAVALAERAAELLPATRREREIPLRSTAAEIGAALRMSDRTVQRRLNDAWTLSDRFPATCAALADGRISRAHVEVILDAGVPIDDDDSRAAFERDALVRAEAETPARLRSIVAVLAERHHPTSITDRHRRARRTRGVFAKDTADGMGELLVVGPAVLIHGIHDRLTQYAHRIRTDAADADGMGARSDDRTMDQLRADVLADLLLSGTTTAAGDGLDAIRAHVQVTVPAGILTGDGAGAGTGTAILAGLGPIDAGTARRLAGAAVGWDRLLLHPVTGALLCVDRYRPNADLKRHLRARDEHCRFPGCRQPIWRTDIDHSTDHARGGPTAEHNLAHLCKRHHTLKHAAQWIIVHLGHGVLQWTSPTGRVYIDTPTPTLRFIPADPADDPPPGDPPPF